MLRYGAGHRGCKSGTNGDGWTSRNYLPRRIGNCHRLWRRHLLVESCREPKLRDLRIAYGYTGDYNDIHRNWYFSYGLHRHRHRDHHRESSGCHQRRP